MSTNNKSPKPLKDLLDQKFGGQEPEVNKYITREFQDFGCRIAEELADPKHTALYIKLAKEKPRALLEEALRWVSDYPEARNKGKLFMWKLKELGQTSEQV